MTSNIYLNPGTKKVWTSSGGDFTLDYSNGGSGVANGAGRLGAQGDLGAAPRPGLYRYFGQFKMQASGLAVGNTVDMYLAFWDLETSPTVADGGITSTTDGAYSTANLYRNFQRLKPVIIDQTGANTYYRSGVVLIPTRYVSPVILNNSGATSDTTGTNHKFTLTPVNWQSQ